jgi:hypothetical protein
MITLLRCFGAGSDLLREFLGRLDPRDEVLGSYKLIGGNGGTRLGSEVRVGRSCCESWVLVCLRWMDTHTAMNLKSLAGGSQAKTNVVSDLITKVYRVELVTGAEGWKLGSVGLVDVRRWNIGTLTTSKCGSSRFPIWGFLLPRRPLTEETSAGLSAISKQRDGCEMEDSRRVLAYYDSGVYSPWCAISAVWLLVNRLGRDPDCTSSDGVEIGIAGFPQRPPTHVSHQDAKGQSPKRHVCKEHSSQKRTGPFVRGRCK